MKKQIIFITLFFIVLLNACHNPKTEDVSETNCTDVLKDCSVVAHYKLIGGDSVLVCDMDAMDDKVEIHVTDLVSSYQIVPLDTCDEALCRPFNAQLQESENYICVVSGTDGSPIRLFDRKTGKYLHQIGNCGQGPTEYTAAYQIQVEEDSGKVFVTAAYPPRLIQYNLSTGMYEKDYKLLFPSAKKVYCDIKKREITAMGYPWPNYEPGTYCFWKQTFDGELIQGISGIEQVGCSYHNRGAGYIDDRSNSYNIILWDTATVKSDTLYHYDLKENRLIPKFTIKWEDKIPPHHYLELPGYYYCETLNKDNLQYLIDKRTGQGAKVKLKLNMLEKRADLKLISHKNNSYGFSLVFDPLDFAEALSKKERQKRIAGKIMNPDSLQNENCWVLIGNWK